MAIKFKRVNVSNSQISGRTGESDFSEVQEVWWNWVCVCFFVLFYTLVLKADPAHDLAEEVEVLGRFASFGVGLFLAPSCVSGQFLLEETGVDP